MASLKILIQSLNDVANGKPMLEGVTPEQVKETTDITIAIQEHGTVGGQNSLMILLKNADGSISMGQITAGLFESLVGAYNGAVQRFESEKAGKN